MYKLYLSILENVEKHYKRSEQRLIAATEIIHLQNQPPVNFRLEMLCRYSPHFTIFMKYTNRGELNAVKLTKKTIKVVGIFVTFDILFGYR